MITRPQLIGALATLLFSAGAIASPAEEKAVSIEIASQPIEEALNEFGRQVNLHVVLYSEVARGVNSRPVSGTLTPQEALERLLKDSGLRYEYLDASTVAIMPAEEGRTEKPVAGVAVEKEMRLAQAGESGQSTEQPSNKNDEPQTEELEEIVVTAQKRVERLLDVPVPVTVLEAATLTSTNQLRAEDYYSSVPGLNLVKDDQASVISIRGLSSGFINPTVGIVVDDIPFGSSLIWGGGQHVPDFDPGDLQRIEVLRGPQGTLYGTSSLGGLLKYVTVSPSLDRLSGQVQAGTLSASHGELGYNLRGSINVPLKEDSFAVRASAFTRRQPGYIDNVATGVDDANEINVEGGLLSALWRPSEAFSLQLNAQKQRSEADGSSEVQQRDTLSQDNLIGTGPWNTHLDAYSAILNARLGNAQLTSLTGYSEFRNFGIQQLLTFPLHYRPEFSTDKYSQEVRLDMPLGERFDWLLGAFYTHEKSLTDESVFLIDGTTGEEVATAVHVASSGKYEEYAAFTNLTIDVTDRFDVQLGGRQAHYKQRFRQDWQFFDNSVVPPVVTPFTPPLAFPKDDAFTYLLTPRFKVSPDLMVYARFASGYRSGSANSNNGTGVLPVVDPDTTTNYELGAKGQALDGALTFDASVYCIDWDDIQLLTTDLTLAVPTGIFVNVNGARSQGVELSFDVKPFKGFDVGLWLAWNDAELTADMPSTTLAKGESGDRLPFSPKFSGQLSLEHEFPATADWMGFVGGSVKYIGERIGPFGDGATFQRQTMPEYTEAAVNAGVRSDSWSVGLYVNNLFDERGVLNARDLGATTRYLLIQPRTIGLNISRSF